MDKKERRIIYLMSKWCFRPKCELPKNELRDAKLDILLKNKKIELDIFLGVSPKSREHKERNEVFDFYYSRGFDNDQIQNIWRKTYLKNLSRKDPNQNSMPKPERKDNQNPVTNTRNYGSGGGNGSRLRVPSKKHKNRYKNFLKLFPWYEDKN